MCQGGGEETASASDGGDAGKNGEGLPGLQPANELGNVIQIYGADTDGLG